MCNCRTERNLFRSCTAERLENSARQVVGKVGLWHEKHAKRPKKSMGLHMELALRQKEPVQLDDDLRCNDLSRRLQLYRHIAGTVVLQHAATCTTRSSKCQLPIMTVVGSALNLHELYRYTCYTNTDISITNMLANRKHNNEANYVSPTTVCLTTMEIKRHRKKERKK